MAPEDWLACNDPARLLEWLTRDKTIGRWGDRKLRLLACACRRQTRLGWDGPSAGWRRMEDHPEEPVQADTAAPGIVVDAMEHALLFARDHRHPDVSLAVAAALLRSIINPFAPPLPAEVCTPLVVRLAEAAYSERTCLTCGHSESAHHGHVHRPGTPETTHCSQGCGCRAFAADGTLDPERLLILSDALEEAGLVGERDHDWMSSGFKSVTAPCRRCGVEWATDEHRKRGNVCQPVHPLLASLRSPGPHYRGLWSLDQVLSKE